MLHGFVQVVAYIFSNLLYRFVKIYLLKFLHGFFKIDIHGFLYSKWLYGFVKVLNGFFLLFQGFVKVFLCMSRPFAEQNQAEV